MGVFYMVTTKGRIAVRAKDYQTALSLHRERGGEEPKRVDTATTSTVWTAPKEEAVTPAPVDPVALKAILEELRRVLG